MRLEILALMWIGLPVMAYLDYRLFKNPKTRSRVERVVALKTDRDIFIEYLKTCAIELLWFTSGFLLAFFVP